METVMRHALTLPSRQKGVTLFISLIALVAMTLAAIALMRAVDTGNQIAGNLAFKQGATAAGDAGIEAARTWILANAAGSTLNNDSPANGYYANSQDTLDVMGNLTPGNTGDDVDWTGNNSAGYADNAKVLGSQVSGNTIAYVINRLCLPAAQGGACVSYGQNVSSGSTMGGGSYGSKPLSGSSQIYYKITVRVQGPRNTVSFVESVLLI